MKNQSLLKLVYDKAEVPLTVAEARDVLETLSIESTLNTEVIEKMSLDCASGIRMAIAGVEDLPRSVVRRLALDSSSEVRRELLSQRSNFNSLTAEEIIRSVADDSGIIADVARNIPNHPEAEKLCAYYKESPDPTIVSDVEQAFVNFRKRRELGLKYKWI